MAKLQKQSYNQTKKLLLQGELNREQIAKQVHISHTIVSRVNKTERYEDYLEKFGKNSRPRSQAPCGKRQTSRTTKPVRKDVVGVAEKPVRGHTVKNVRKPVKKSIFVRIKEFFS